MITAKDITEGSKFKTKDGLVWVIDEVKQGLVRTSLQSLNTKGNYRDTLTEVVEFLNEQDAKKVKMG